MDLFFINLWWMTFNVALALIGCVAGWITLKTRNRIVRSLITFVWILFLPNTIYLVTDLQHLKPHLQEVALPYAPLILMQYVLLTLIGILTFVLGLYPLEIMVTALTMRPKIFATYAVIAGVSCIISFGVVLGKIYRVHSWEIVTNPSLVISYMINIINSPLYLLFVFFFGAGSSLLYLTCRKRMFNVCRKILLQNK